MAAAKCSPAGALTQLARARDCMVRGDVFFWTESNAGSVIPVLLALRPSEDHRELAHIQSNSGLCVASTATLMS